MLVPSLTVAENIVLGVEPRINKFFIDYNKAVEISQNLADKYNFEIDVTQKVEELPVGIKQKVEILKALYRGADILILDEPTAVLTPQETDELFVQLKKLKDDGHTIIFISHKLDEIKSICDRATIMRNGKSKGTHEVKDISTSEMSKLMVGRDVVLEFDKKPMNLKETVLKVRKLNVLGSTGIKRIDDLSFDLKAGEIFSIAGVEGNGQSHLVEALTGMTKQFTGEVLVYDKDVKQYDIKGIRELGMAHIPEDRMTLGCAGNMNIMDNILSNQYGDSKYSGHMMLKIKSIEKRINELIKEYLIKCKSYRQNVSMLSGGNIQKVVVAREFSTNPKIIIANQPTRGIDVGAASFIRQRIIEFRDAGAAIILISADLNEVFELSDRLAVMYKGKFSGVFKDMESLTEEELGKYMLGIKKDDRLEGITYE
jgi:simple sugar transport system ATP-binding protein